MDIVSVHELFIKHNNQFLLCLTHHSSSCTEWNELPQGRIEIEHSISNPKVCDSALFIEWPTPEWEGFLIHILDLQSLNCLHFEINGCIVTFDMIIVGLEFLN